MFTITQGHFLFSNIEILDILKIQKIRSEWLRVENHRAKDNIYIYSSPCATPTQLCWCLNAKIWSRNDLMRGKQA